MDLTKLSDDDLVALQSGDLSKLSDEGLMQLSGETPPPKSSLRMPLSRTEKVLKGARDPIDAGAQVLTHILPESVVNAGNKLNNFIADKTGLVGRLPEGGVDQQVNEQEAEYQARREAGGETGFDGYRLAGNIVSPANLAIASKVPVAAGAASRLVTGAGSGAVASAASTPVVGEGQDNFVTEKIKQAAVGAIGGAAGQGIANGIARVVSPKASTNAELALLRSEGVRPTVGQTLGGRWNAAEEKLSSFPLVGDMIRKARGKADTQFETAAYNRVLKPIGLRMPANVKGRDAVNTAESFLKNKYDKVLNDIGAVTPDRQFSTEAGELKGMVDNLNMPQSYKDKFAFLLDEVKSTLDKNGVMTSEGYKRLESSLGAKVKKLGSSQDMYDDTIAQAAAQLRDNLKGMLERQAGSHAKELHKTNAAWANFKRVQGAAGTVGAEDGSFNAAQLQSSVRALDKSKDKAAFARGNAQMQDLSEAGKSVLGNKVPNSFTTDRALLATAAGGAGYWIDPTVAATMGAGALAYTPAVQKALTASLASRPQSAAKLAQLIRENGHYIAPASGTALLRLLHE